MIYIAVLDKNNVQMGQFTRAQIAQKLETAEITLDNLAYAPGQSDWTPLRAVLAKVDSNQLRTPERISTAANASAYSDYAGFWLRFVAYFVDTLILECLVLPVAFGIGLTYGIWAARNHIKPGFMDNDGSLNGTFVLMEVSVVIFSLTVRWLYFALQESSSAQATLGKRLIGIRVTDLDGQRIGMARATGRFFAKIPSAMILLIGFIMAGFTERKQALHDMIAGTLVVKG